MPVCPKCQQEIAPSDVEKGSDIVWGRCAHCNILFRVLPDILKSRPPEAEFKTWTEHDRFNVAGIARGLVRSEFHHLTFGQSSFQYRWKSLFFSGEIDVPRERLQSVEPICRDMSPEHKRPRSGYGIQLTYWHVPKWKKGAQPKLRTIRMPLRTVAEQFWLLNEICGFLDRTTRYPSVVQKYRAKEYFGNDTLEMFFENRTVCLRIFCPKCGAGIPGKAIDIRRGNARCPRKYCRHGFSWQDVFEAPITEEEPPAPPFPGDIAGYGELADIRAVHFAANANPLVSIPFGSEPPPTTPLPMPFFERPRIVRKGGRLAIEIEARGQGMKETLFAFFQLAIAAGFFFIFLPSAIVILLYLLTGSASDGGLRENSLHLDPLYLLTGSGADGGAHSMRSLLCFLAGGTILGGLLAGSLIGSFLSRLHSQWGRWNLFVKDGRIDYRRRCGPMRKSVSVPFDAIREIGAKIVTRPWFGQNCESFTPHQIRIRYSGKKTLIIPCNNADEQLWVLGELYESLRKRT